MQLPYSTFCGSPLLQTSLLKGAKLLEFSLTLNYSQSSYLRQPYMLIWQILLISDHRTPIKSSFQYVWQYQLGPSFLLTICIFLYRPSLLCCDYWTTTFSFHLMIRWLTASLWLSLFLVISCSLMQLTLKGYLHPGPAQLVSLAASTTRARYGTQRGKECKPPLKRQLFVFLADTLKQDPISECYHESNETSYLDSFQQTLSIHFPTAIPSLSFLKHHVSFIMKLVNTQFHTAIRDVAGISF